MNRKATTKRGLSFILALSVFIAIFIGIFPGVSAMGPQVIQNGDFESVTQNTASSWRLDVYGDANNFSYGVVADDYGHCANIKKTGDGTAYLVGKPFRISPSTPYMLTYKIKTIANSPTAQVMVLAQQYLYDYNGVSNNHFYYISETAVYGTTNGWKTVAVPITTQPDAVNIDLRFLINESGNNDVYIDDVALTALSGPKVVNGDFESGAKIDGYPAFWGNGVDIGGANVAITVDANGYQGSSAMKFTKTGTGGKIILPDSAIKVNPNTSYSLSYYAKTLNADTSKQYFTIRQFKTASGNDGAGTDSNAYLTPSQNYGTFDWQPFTVNFTTEPDTNYINLWAVFTDNIGFDQVLPAEAWIDDISITKTNVNTAVGLSPTGWTLENSQLISNDGVDGKGAIKLPLAQGTVSKAIYNYPTTTLVNGNTYTLSYYVKGGATGARLNVFTGHVSETPKVGTWVENEFGFYLTNAYAMDVYSEWTKVTHTFTAATNGNLYDNGIFFVLNAWETCTYLIDDISIKDANAVDAVRNGYLYNNASSTGWAQISGPSSDFSSSTTRNGSTGAMKIVSVYNPDGANTLMSIPAPLVATRQYTLSYYVKGGAAGRSLNVYVGHVSDIPDPLSGATNEFSTFLTNAYAYGVYSDWTLITHTFTAGDTPVPEYSGKITFGLDRYGASEYYIDDITLTDVTYGANYISNGNFEPAIINCKINNNNFETIAPVGFTYDSWNPNTFVSINSDSPQSGINSLMITSNESASTNITSSTFPVSAGVYVLSFWRKAKSTVNSSFACVVTLSNSSTIEYPIGAALTTETPAGWDLVVANVSIPANAVSAKVKMNVSNGIVRYDNILMTKAIDYSNINISQTNVITKVDPGTSVTAMKQLLDPDTETFSLAFTNSLGSAIDLENIIGTGSTMVITQNSVNTNYTIVILGDVNGDGAIILDDLATIKAHLLRSSTITNSSYLSAGDIFKDGSVSISDLLAMKKDILGISSITQ